MKEIEINMVLSVPNKVMVDEVSDKFVDWVEGNKWTCGGGVKEVDYIELQTEEEYNKIMKEIISLMSKGEDKLTSEEMMRVYVLAKAAENDEYKKFDLESAFSKIEEETPKILSDKVEKYMDALDGYHKNKK